MTMPSVVNYQDNQQRQIRVRVARHRDQVNTHAWDVHRLTEERGALQQNVRELHTTRPVIPGRLSIVPWIMLFCLVAAYVLDVVLFGPVGEYFAQQNFPEHPWMQWVSRLAIPVGIIGIELVLCAQAMIAQEDWENGLGTRARYHAWNVVALLFALGVPTGAVVTYVANGNDFPPAVHALLILMLAVLAVGPHVAIVLGRRPLLEGLDAIRCGFRERRAQRQLDGMTGNLNDEQQQVRASFGNYINDLNRHNTLYSNDRITPEPFDEVTRRVLRDLYGYDVVPAQPAAAAAPTGANEEPQAAPSTPTAPPAGDNPPPADGENEYLRTILSRRQSEEESEVR